MKPKPTPAITCRLEAVIYAGGIEWYLLYKVAGGRHGGCLTVSACDAYNILASGYPAGVDVHADVVAAMGRLVADAFNDISVDNVAYRLSPPDAGSDG